MRTTPDEAAAIGAIQESLKIYETLRLGNAGTNDITIAVVKPLKEFSATLNRTDMTDGTYD